MIPEKRGKHRHPRAASSTMDQHSIHEQNTPTLLLDHEPCVGRVVAMARSRCNLRRFFSGIILQGYENHPRVCGNPERKH